MTLISDTDWGNWVSFLKILRNRTFFSFNSHETFWWSQIVFFVIEQLIFSKCLIFVCGFGNDFQIEKSRIGPDQTRFSRPICFPDRTGPDFGCVFLPGPYFLSRTGFLTRTGPDLLSRIYFLDRTGPDWTGFLDRTGPDFLDRTRFFGPDRT